MRLKLITTSYRRLDLLRHAVFQMQSQTFESWQWFIRLCRRIRNG